jgi:hypothetical protein
MRAAWGQLSHFVLAHSLFCNCVAESLADPFLAFDRSAAL